MKKCKMKSLIKREFIFVCVGCACSWLGRWLVLHSTVGVILAEWSLMSLACCSHRFLEVAAAVRVYRNELGGLNMNCIIGVSVFNHCSLDTSFDFVLWSWSSDFLNIEHFSDLIRWLSDFPESGFGGFSPQYFDSTFFFVLLILFVLYEGDAISGPVIAGCGLVEFELIEVFLLQFVHVELSFLHWVDKLMKDPLFLVGLFLPDVAFSNEIVVLCLVFQMVQVHLLICLLVVLLEKHHVLLQIRFVFL